MYLVMMFFSSTRSTYVCSNNRAKVLEDIEKEMSELIVCPVGNASSANDVVESGEPVETAPATKKEKGLSKVLGQCLGKSSSTSTGITLCQWVKQELDLGL